MTDKLQAILRQIDQFLAVGDDDSGRLWALINGQRGPDSDDNGLKYDTSCYVRGATFPLALASGYLARDGGSGRKLIDVNGAFFMAPVEGWPEKAIKACMTRNAQWHFRSHLLSAMRILVDDDNLGRG